VAFPFTKLSQLTPGAASRAKTVGDAVIRNVRRGPSSSTELVDLGARVTLDESYAICQELNKRYGTTYYWSTHLLPAIKRHHVHALYGLCRYADDIVDDLGTKATNEQRAAALKEFGDRFFADFAAGKSEHPVLKAVVHTVRSFEIAPEAVRRFLDSMTMDLTVSTYENYADLEIYMDGSAAVIGEMMLPILEPRDIELARPHARDLGNAFQLTNFLRDVAEDLDRNRVYIPQVDLRRFDADPHKRVSDVAWKELMRFEIARCRTLYESADLGVAMLAPSSQRCIKAARDLYGGILGKIEAANYDVFRTRVRVTKSRKLAMAAKLLKP
jgi:15-cis-phytoene synthase